MKNFNVPYYMAKIVYRYRIYCETESTHVYTWGDSIPVLCPNDHDHDITSSTITIIDQVSDTVSDEHDFNKNLFNESQVSMQYPIVQNYTPYGVISDQVYVKYSASGGTISKAENNVDIELSTTNSIGSYAVLRSKKVLKSVPGTVNTYRGAARFNAPVASSLQFIGVGNACSDLYFAYTGMDFCIRKSTGGRLAIYKLTITGTESSTRTATVILNSIEFTIPLTDTDNSLELTASQIAHTMEYTGWRVEQIENCIIFSSTSVGAKNGIYSFTSTGNATGDFIQIEPGIALTTENISQVNWNGSSRMVTDVNPQMNNLYEIEYAYGGLNNILFKILNPDTGFCEVVHTLKFANTTEQSPISAPNLYIQSGIASMGSITPMKLAITYTSALSNLDPYRYTGRGSIINNITNTLSVNKNENTNIMVLKNRRTINGIATQSTTMINKITFISDGSKPVIIRIFKNPTTISLNNKTDFQNYKYVDEETAIAIYDINSKTHTGGTLLDTFFTPKEGMSTLDLSDRELHVHQDDVLLFTVFSENYSTINMSITFMED